MNKKSALFFLLYLGFGSIQAKPFQPPKHIPLPLSFAKKQLPLQIKPEKVTDETIHQKSKEFLDIKKKLYEHSAQNETLQSLKNEKKAIKNSIKKFNASLVKEQKNNQSIFVAYQKAKAHHAVSKELQNKVDTILKNIGKQQDQLSRYLKKLHTIKQSMHKASPERKILLKKMHTAKKQLQEMKLIKLSKPSEQPKK
jgi:hypothetical protein